MTREFSRSLRVAEQVQRELALLIRQEVKDPRIGMVTVSEVRVSSDLGHATVFVTLLDGDAEATAESVAILNHAAAFLRRALGKRLLLRVVPQLKFVHDEVQESGARLTALIDASVAEDRKKSENNT